MFRLISMTLLLVAAPASATRITIHAPVDGHIGGSVPLENSIHDGAISESKVIYDILRRGSELDPVYHPLETEFPDKKTLDEQIFGISESDAAPESESDTAPESKSEAAPKLFESFRRNDNLLEIRSDVLELQLIEEIRKYQAAKKRLAISERLLTVEEGLKEDIVALRDNQKTAKDLEASEFYSNHKLRINREGRHRRCTDRIAPRVKNCLGTTMATQGRKAIKAVSSAQSKIDKDRYDARLKELENLRQISQANLDSAKQSILVVLATMRLGNVVCPKRCKIQDVYVVPGQYVNKGDPLFTFTWLKEI